MPGGVLVAGPEDVVDRSVDLPLAAQLAGGLSVPSLRPDAACIRRAVWLLYIEWSYLATQLSQASPMNGCLIGSVS